MIGTGEDLGAAYKHQQMQIPADQFLEEYHRFRKIMGLKKYTTEEKEEYFGGLTYVYLNINEDDPKLQLCIDAFVALADEWSRRKAMMMFQPPTKDEDNGCPILG